MLIYAPLILLMVSCIVKVQGPELEFFCEVKTMSTCNIATKLSELRMAKGGTQDKVASALSVSNKTISKWENGTSSPDLSMLVSLAKYYNVSTDTLLGLEDKRKGTKQVIANEFRGLDRCETVLKVFEIIKEMFPASFNAVSAGDDSGCDDMDAIPSQTDRMSRYQISLHELFYFAVCSDDVNFAVVQLRNKSNFTWLLDEKKQKHIIDLFGFLADADVLKIMSFIHSTVCSESFTARYMSNNTTVPLDKTTSVLEKSCELGICSKATALLKNSEVIIYESFGDGLILSILSIAYERMCGSNGYNYNYNGRCKMIGGKKI